MTKPATRNREGHLLVDDIPPDDHDEPAAPTGHSPVSEPELSDLDALDGVRDVEPADDDPAEISFTVTNPAGSVCVSALTDGSVRRVALTGEVTTMTESDLAEEILVIAGLATQDARAAQYAYMLEGMRQQGHDEVATRDFLARDLDLPSPEDASAARARLFAMRYAGDHD